MKPDIFSAEERARIQATAIEQQQALKDARWPLALKEAE